VGRLADVWLRGAPGVWLGDGAYVVKRGGWWKEHTRQTK
jgi:hypothetical protein